MKTNLSAHLIALCALVIPISHSRAQLPTPTPTPPGLPTPPYAIVTYASASTSTSSLSVVSPCVEGVFGLVGLQPDQVIQVVVQYPTSQALQLVSLEALDGGTILPPSSVSATTTNVSIGQLLQGVPIPATPQVASLVISANGTLTFTFKATHDPGRNQIALRQGGQELGLQFWVFDLQNAANNPVAITPATPNPSI